MSSGARFGFFAYPGTLFLSYRRDGWSGSRHDASQRDWSRYITPTIGRVRSHDLDVERPATGGSRSGSSAQQPFEQQRAKSLLPRRVRRRIPSCTSLRDGRCNMTPPMPRCSAFVCCILGLPSPVRASARLTSRQLWISAGSCKITTPHSRGTYPQPSAGTAAVARDVCPTFYIQRQARNTSNHRQ